jgi:CrcB protein
MQALYLSLAVAAGGAIGSVLRHLLASGIVRQFGNDFPYAILSINILGSLIMGILIEVLTHYVPGHQTLRAFLAVGILGGFTTFSSFSLDALVLMERGDFGAATLYVAASVGFSLLAIFLGMIVTRSIIT